MKKSLLILLTLTLIFTACKDDEISSLSVIIEGSVFDQKNNAAVEGATVEITSDDKTYTATTNANGFYSMGSLPTGEYTIKISKDDYLSYVTMVGSDDVTVNSKTEVVTINNSIYLSPLSESLTMTIYISFNGKRIAAKNKDFTMSFTQSGNDTISGTTDEYGLLDIGNLPYRSTCYINFDFSIDGVRFKKSIYYYSTNSYDNNETIFGYYDNGDFGLVESNILDSKGSPVEDFDTTASLTFKFTQPVDTANANIYFSPAHTLSWSEGNMLLTVDPEDNLNEDTQYYISYNLDNEDESQSTSDGIYFRTEEK